MMNFQEIHLDQISPSPLNPRMSFSKDKLDELAASIKQKGVIEPIIVRPAKAKKASYEIVAGEQSCFNAVTNPRTAKEKAKAERDPEAPRATWHGIYFRDKFLRTRLEALLDKEAENPNAERTARLCLYALLKSSREGRIAAGAALGMKPKESWRLPGKALDLKVINELPAQDILRNTVRAVKAVILEGQVAISDRPINIGVGGNERQLLAEFLGVDLTKEYAVDADYLAKKTRAEVLAFIKQFKLFPLDNVAKMKKKDLDKAVLALGQKLAGKTPNEIIGRKA